MYYVYKFVDKNNEVLYVGQTIDFDRRFSEHKGKIWDKEKDHIEFAKCKSCVDMNLYELYYINKLHAKYNTSLVFNEEPSFELPELEWEIYNKDHFEIKKIERDNEFKRYLKREFSPETYWLKRKGTLEEQINYYKEQNNEKYKDLEEKLVECEKHLNDIK